MNLTIKLTSSEMSDFTDAMTVLLSYSKPFKKGKYYFHYLNIKSFWKRLFDAHFKGFSKKNASVKIDVNEFESIKFIINYVKDPGTQIFYDYSSSYHGMLLQYVMGSLDKQSINLKMLA